MARNPASGERRTAPKKQAASRKAASRAPKPSPEAADHDPFDTPEKAFAEAERLIEEARVGRAKELNIELRYLKDIPDSIAGLTGLQSLLLDNTAVTDLVSVAALTGLQTLSLTGTQVADLGPLAGLTSLQALFLAGTRVMDLSPLAVLPDLHGLWLDVTKVTDFSPLAALASLRSLSLHETKVTDLNPLASLTNLAALSLDDTQITDLGPLAALTGLRTLWCDRTPVSDLTPLAGLAGLQSLMLDGTQVSDLAPLASLTALIDGVIARETILSGLHYHKTPVSRRKPFKDLIKLQQPARTVETINYLRRQQGMPEYRPSSSSAPPPLPESTEPRGAPPPVPTPRPAAVEPDWRNGRLTLPTTPAAGDLDKPDLDAALQALKALLTELAEDASHEGNIDKRMVVHLRRTADKIPDTAPPQAQLFMIAHDLKRLQGYAATVTGEWPAPLAASYHGMLLTYDQTVRQFPRWRAFETNALKDRLSEPQVADAPAAAREAAADFRSKESADLIDAAIPEAIDALTDALGAANDSAQPGHPIEIGQDQLALDTLESINNVYKGIASAALKGWEFMAPERGGASEGLSEGRKQVVKEIKKDAKALYPGAYRWMKRLAKTGLVGGTAGAGLLLAGLPQKLIASYPGLFSWLEPVLRFFW